MRGHTCGARSWYLAIGERAGTGAGSNGRLSVCFDGIVGSDVGGL